MTKSRIGLTLLAGALLLSTSAFAGNNSKGTLRLEDSITVDGTPLQPGNYKVQWDGSGPDVKVTLSQGSRTVATFPAHVTEQKAATQADAYGSANQPDGGKTLTAIYFGGKHYALQVEPTTAAQPSQANPTPAQ